MADRFKGVGVAKRATKLQVKSHHHGYITGVTVWLESTQHHLSCHKLQSRCVGVAMKLVGTCARSGRAVVVVHHMQLLVVGGAMCVVGVHHMLLVGSAPGCCSGSLLHPAVVHHVLLVGSGSR